MIQLIKNDYFSTNFFSTNTIELGLAAQEPEVYFSMCEQRTAEVCLEIFLGMENCQI